ncbi:MAG: hypothetical protein COA66_15800 [Arcobacter sp.]|nr:MAG: hypothetical protein COA66_15800 [Arcobacter sp.]
MKKLLLSLLLLGSSVFASSYQLDTAHSKISFKVKHMAISNVYGSFTNFDATIDYNEDTKVFKELSAKVVVASIDTNNVKRDGHLKSEDFFNEKVFPNITFKLLSVNADEAKALLTIKGISKEVILDFENNGTVKDPWGNTKLGLSFSTKISRKMFGLTWNKLLETGSLIVGDKITITVDLEAKKI